MRIALAALMLALLAAPTAARADDFPEISASASAQLEPRIDAFLERVQAGDVAGAYEEILRGSLVEGRRIEVNQLVGQTSTMVDLLGSLHSWERFDSECVTQRICLVKYAAYFERGALGVWFRFYQDPSGQWILTSIFLGDTPEFFS